MDGTTVMSETRIYWGAVLAGVTIALALQSLFNLLGLGLGFTAFKGDTNTIANIGIGSVVWLIITGILSTYIGAWITGRFTPIRLGFEGMLHGLTTWGLSTLFVFLFMATSASAFISGMGNMVNQGVSLVGGGGAMQSMPSASQATQTISPNLQPAINQVIQQSDHMVLSVPDHSNRPLESQDRMRTELRQGITSLLIATDTNGEAIAKERLVFFLEQHTEMDQTQAEQTVNMWQQNFNGMKQQLITQASKAAEQATSMLGRIAIIVFFAFLTSAIAGALGGMLGARADIKRVGKI